MQIDISKEDYEFLKDLQHELNTQENDGQAEPKYWGVLDTHVVAVPEGCGDAMIYIGDGNTLDLNEAIAYIDENIEDYLKEIQDTWNTLKTYDSNMSAMVEFMNNTLGWNARIVWQKEEKYISDMTGCFLTKRACNKYIESNRHNHCDPHTYAMTAFRNYEYERLLNILKTMKL